MQSPSTAPQADRRPPYLPEKFWNAANGQADLEALAKSYAELERKMSSGGAPRPAPERPDDYRIAIDDPWFENDPKLNARLHRAGFTQEQAQVVYDLARDYVRPLIEELLGHFESRQHLDRCCRHFGGEERWSEVARQVAAWGKSHLPPNVYRSLATSFEGIVVMQRMMEQGEPALLQGGQARGGAPREADLKKMMDDPRYWRDHDPVLVAKIREGWQRLYPNEG